MFPIIQSLNKSLKSPPVAPNRDSSPTFATTAAPATWLEVRKPPSLPVELGTGAAMSETRPGQLEINPIQLFRVRCLREAEEKFWEGLLKNESRGFIYSSSSFLSANDGRATALAFKEVPRLHPLRYLQFHNATIWSRP